MNINIMIVDSDSIVRKSISNYLKEKGRIVYVACSGEEAIITQQKHRCEIIILDILMVEINGADFLKHLKQAQPITKIVLITKHNVMRNSMRWGADAIVSKPLSMVELFEHVECLEYDIEKIDIKA